MYVPQLLIGTRQEVVYGCEEEKGNAVQLMRMNMKFAINSLV